MSALCCCVASFYPVCWRGGWGWCAERPDAARCTDVPPWPFACSVGDASAMAVPFPSGLARPIDPCTSAYTWRMCPGGLRPRSALEAWANSFRDHACGAIARGAIEHLGRTSTGEIRSFLEPFPYLLASCYLLVENDPPQRERACGTIGREAIPVMGGARGWIAK